MTATSETRTWDTIVSTTYDAYRNTLIDNIFKSNPAMMELKAKGATRTEDGGVQIIEPLMYGKNTTIGSYEGYDVIDTTPQEGITSALFPWAQVAGSITISRKERRQNSGKHQIINLVSAKIKQAEMSMQEKFSQYLFGTGKYNTSQATKDPAGFRAMIPQVPSSFNAGGITVSSNTWWRNKVMGNADTKFIWVSDTGDTPASPTGINALNKLYNNCGKGPGGSPSCIIGSQAFFEQYQSGVLPMARVPANQMAADLGFPNLRFNGATVYWDENFATASVVSGGTYEPDDTTGDANGSGAAAYFLNPNFMSMVTDAQSNFIRTPFVRPHNQDADTSLILWMGNTTINNRRKHGVFVDDNATIIS